MNGQEAVELWKKLSPHLILMDIRMPVMDGYGAVKTIREMENETQNRKEETGSSAFIIAVTAHAFEEDRKAVLAAGCNDFIRKPFDESELFEKIALYLNVCYSYGASCADDQKKTVRTDLKPGDLADFPDEWLAQVRLAALRGNANRLLELTEHIRTGHPVTADALTHLTQRYQFKKIADMTPEKEQENECV